MKAILLLSDGTIFEGIARGIKNDKIGEVVFNTSMTGYQEILTDPSYAGQIVAMTFPLIGNYGINEYDFESKNSFVKGFVVRELCDTPSNFRCGKTLDEFLCEQQLTAIEGVDTRALTKHIRAKGCMNGAILCGDISEEKVNKALEEIQNYNIVNPVLEVTVKEKEYFKSAKKEFNVALYDFGYKKNILSSLKKRGCDITIYPATATCEEILNDKPDGIMLTNGPGDPKDCKEIINNLRKLIESGIPVFGICLGHQLTALAMGGDTKKMTFGHRGTNHPVKDLRNDRTYITSQNHGYAVIENSIPNDMAIVSHININDNTVEGIEYKKYPVSTVQFHPEASSGTMDTAYLFDNFINVMRKNKNGGK